MKREFFHCIYCLNEVALRDHKLVSSPISHIVSHMHSSFLLLESKTLLIHCNILIQITCFFFHHEISNYRHELLHNIDLSFVDICMYYITIRIFESNSVFTSGICYFMFFFSVCIVDRYKSNISI